jgi:hypothetical protein
MGDAKQQVAGADIGHPVPDAGSVRFRRRQSTIRRALESRIATRISSPTPSSSACLAVLREGVHSADVILNILARRREPPQPQAVWRRRRCGLRLVPTADCGRYDRLRSAAVFDEILGRAVKRQHEPQWIIGELLNAEISEKWTRSIRYQITIAKLPLAKDLEEFRFVDTPINESLVRDLAGGNFLAHQRNLVLVGGTGTGKTHLAIAIARGCIRDGARGRFFNVVDLVNKLEAEARAGRQGRLAGYLCRKDFFVLDELGYLPIRAVRQSVTVPSDQPALRADLCDPDNQSRLW